jgi:dUTP pyrophosphatase
MREVLIKRLDPDIPLPSYAKAGDAGADLATRIDFTIKPGERIWCQLVSVLLYLMVM